MSENIAFSLALDLLFNGQDMDYCERPISLSAVFQMSLFVDLPPKAYVGVIAPGGGRLVRNLAARGYAVDAFEGRIECMDHLKEIFRGVDTVELFTAKYLDDPIRRQRHKYDALFCMDDLRAFREHHEWTEDVQKMVKDGGYFVYSQVSNKLPSKKNTLDRYFNLAGTYNVTEETANAIKNSYLGLDDWEPEDDQKKMALRTLDMVESASDLRRSIRSGVEVRYVVWRKKKSKKAPAED